MSYVPRQYEEIVRDLLTTLTGGTVRETIKVPIGEGPIVLPKLQNRPVRRVSHIEGLIEIEKMVDVPGPIPGEKIPERQKVEVRHRFTPAEFELVSSTGDENEKDAVRFREGSPLPIAGRDIVVNYYPVQTDPVPLTDLNVGSVVRTLMETFARELALGYLHLEQIYKSAYLDTAEGRSLDQVVVLVGARRLPAGHPVVKVRFTRQSASAGRITVPTRTPLIDDEGNRYLTLHPVTLEPGETSREVLAGGEKASTGTIEPGLLRMEVRVAGIASGTNIQPARVLNSPETDEQLRLRARGALQGMARGTVEALKFGLLSVEGVKDVAIVEAPNGVSGEIRINVAYGDDNPAVRKTVADRIDDLRPAGIRVLTGEAGRMVANVRVELTLAGTGVAEEVELTEIQNTAKDRITEYLENLPPGGLARRSRLAALVLEDARVADARIVLIPGGHEETEDLSLPAGQILEVGDFHFPQPSVEEQPGAPQPITARVSAVVPVHLVSGVTLAEATDVINVATASHLATRRTDAPLTVDGLIADIRDDTRYVVVREDAVVTVETGDRFRELTDGLGVYAPAEGESLQQDVINVQAREGEV